MYASSFTDERERLAAAAFALGRALHPKAGGGFRISRWATGEHVDAADLAEVGQRLQLIERVELECRDCGVMYTSSFTEERNRLAAVAFALGRALHPKAGGGFRISRWATGEHVDAADLAEVGQRLKLIERVERERRYRDQAAHAHEHA